MLDGRTNISHRLETSKTASQCCRCRRGAARSTGCPLTSGRPRAAAAPQTAAAPTCGSPAAAGLQRWASVSAGAGSGANGSAGRETRLDASAHDAARLPRAGMMALHGAAPPGPQPPLPTHLRRCTRARLVAQLRWDQHPKLGACPAAQQCFLQARHCAAIALGRAWAGAAAGERL